jgi:hypothetical protein
MLFGPLYGQQLLCIAQSYIPDTGFSSNGGRTAVSICVVNVIAESGICGLFTFTITLPKATCVGLIPHEGARKYVLRIGHWIEGSVSATKHLSQVKRIILRCTDPFHPTR